MQFMVELHYSQEHRTDALRYFWEHGFTHHGAEVTVEGVWVATEDLVAYAIVKGQEVSEVEKACAALASFGDVVIRRVTDSDVL